MVKLRGGDQPLFFWKSNFRDNSWPNSTTHRGNFWWGFGTRAPIRAWATPIPIYGHRQMLFLFLAQYYANRGLSERSRSPEYQDIKIFEIGWKMTELWALTRCPNMGADAIMALKSALKWANINIFNGTFFIWLVGINYMPVVNENCIAIKTWILWPKNLKKYTKSRLSRFANLEKRRFLDVILLLGF